MKTTFISTSAISEATRSSLSKLQAKLAESQKEVVTGRHADIGKALGHKTGDTVSLRQEFTRLTTIIETNSVVESRLDLSQAVLTGVVANAQDFIGQLIGSRNTSTGPGIIEGQAQAGIVSLTDALNTAINDGYLFAGINADVSPITDYYATPTSPNRQAVADAFFATFGMTQDDPAVETIAPGDMQTFLDTTFADLFSELNWSMTWSSASDQNVKSRISSSELIETSTNANELGVRKLAQAYAMVADLGTAKLSQGAYQIVIDQATRLAGEAIQDLTKLQANLGTAQERVENANTRMSIQVDIMTTHINVLEGVDPYEASTKVSAILTQIETAYALTARVQNLSLLNYL